MIAKIKQIIGSLLDIEQHERLKFIYLTLTYFMIIGGYTISRELKYLVLTNIVGPGNVLLQARWLFMLSFIIPLYIYSKLVDRLRRYQLLYVCSLFFGIIGLVCTYYLGHPTIGLPNTNANSWRLFGWFFYFFIESYLPFMLSVFWAFVNSITDQESAKQNYGLMVAGSKVGGMLGALFAIGVLTFFSVSNVDFSGHMKDVANHQLLLAVASVICLIIPFIIWRLMKKVPGRYLHGYEAAYKIEKERHKHGTLKTGFVAGVKMLFYSPYVFGIFAIVFFHELIYPVLTYQRVCIAHSGINANSPCSSLSEMSIFLYQTSFLMHFLGFFISLFGTRALIEWLGEKKSLVLVPISYGILLLFLMASYTKYSFIFVSSAIQAIHYAFSFPLRESLYIPTVKEIKFKSKSWIDTFGAKFGRLNSSAFSWLVNWLGSGYFFSAHILFFGVIASLWGVVAYYLGARFEKAIEHNQVIGANLVQKDQEEKKDQAVEENSRGT